MRLMTPFTLDRDCAEKLDESDPLGELRQEFLLPKLEQKTCAYFCGNSLGLQPKKTRDYVGQELDDWADLGVLGHTEKTHGWLSYHELVSTSLAHIVGAEPSEVVAMNSLTTNLHLMLVSFYQPKGNRRKILIEGQAFPSDIYAVKSQIAFHGGDPEQDLLMIHPRPDEDTVCDEDIEELIKLHGKDIALVLLGQVNYLTGQVFDVEKLCQLSHSMGCIFGLDLAHGAGNLKLELHRMDVDFAVWCHYKYLNGGPGTIGGAFVHSKHHQRKLHRFEGWWGTNKTRRFEMKPEFEAIGSAESWQLSNPPILQLAALRASLSLFDQVGMDALHQKKHNLNSYLRFILASFKDVLDVITPEGQGCQVSVRLKSPPQSVLEKLEKLGIICDFRYPDIIRIAPVPMYNSFYDIFRFQEAFNKLLK